MTPVESHWSIKGKLAGWALICGLLFIPACGERNVYAPPPPPEVTVSQPVSRSVVDYLEFTGNTQAINTVELRARVQGYLEKVYFKDGDMVKKGQRLFLIQQDTYQAQLKQAEAQILQQKANLEHAILETARYTKLVQKEAASQTDLDNWRFQKDSLQAAVLAAEANRDLAGLNLDYTTVTAPFDGRIGRRLVDPGNLVGAGEFTALARVNQINPLYVYFTISERDLLQVVGETGISAAQAEQIKIPLALGLANETGYPHQGHLDFAAISLSPTTGTLELRGIFPNPDGKMLPGLFARVRAPILGSEKPSLVIPEAAVGYDQLGPYVLVVGSNKIVERRPVKLGAREDSSHVVREGLTGEDWVIVNGQMQAVPGRAVNPVSKPAAPGPEKTGAMPRANHAGKGVS
ncbi:MAG: efflux RND transporter periplasmic adaptor subunit [Syntrophobacteraceae bacterium]|jgi:RND family efflux transporter MFP subunit